MKNLNKITGYLLLIPFLVSCSSSLKMVIDSEVPIPVVSKLPLTMGIHYDENFRTFKYTEDSEDRPEWEIDSGASQVALFDQVLPSMFQNTTHVDAISATLMTPDTTNGSSIDAIVSPTIDDIQFSLPRETRLDLYEVWIKYKVSIFDNQGQHITDYPLTAYGKSSTEFMKSRDEGLSAAMELALRDAGAKLVLGFTRDTSVREWLTSAVGECENYITGEC